VLSPLLKLKHANPHATLITHLMSAIPYTYRFEENELKRTHRADILKAYDYLDIKTMPRYQYDAQMMCAINMLPLLRDNQWYFER
jgi:hypothetical protein